MKGIVNTRFDFELDEAVNWDIVEVKGGRFHIIYNNAEYYTRVVARKVACTESTIAPMSIITKP